MILQDYETERLRNRKTAILQDCETAGAYVVVAVAVDDDNDYDVVVAVDGETARLRDRETAILRDYGCLYIYITKLF